MLLIEIPENEKEIINKIESLNIIKNISNSKNFNADQGFYTMLIAVLPAIVIELSSIIKYLLDSKKNIKIKINGVEISGLNNNEILVLLDELSQKNLLNKKENSNDD